MNTTTFATLVKEACSTVPASGKFGDNKVFIHAAWAWGQFMNRHEITLPAFKALLWDACQDRQLDLCRADMVEAMDAYDVRRSELSVNGARFNFIRA